MSDHTNLLYKNDQRGHYPDSWYAHDAPCPNPLPQAHGLIKTDVAIIGAGFTGLSAALHLAKEGYKTTVLEAQRVGFGASGRNGGQVGSGLNKDQPELEKKLGKQTARIVWDLTNQAKDTTRHLINTYAPDANYRPGIIGASWHKKEHQDALRHAAYMNDAYGTQLTCLNHDDMATELGTDVYAGGVLDLSAGHIHPLRYAFGLARAALSYGADIYEGSEAIKIEQNSSHSVITTPQAHIEATYLIIACNGYINNTLAPKIAARVMPINGFIAATEPLKDAHLNILRHNYAVADSLFVINYFRLSDDGRLLFGGGENYTHRFPKNPANLVRKPMYKVFPQLKQTPISHAWGGTLGITLNRLPVFIRLGKNILSASGYSGHGVALSGFAGKLMAQAIKGQSEQFDIFAALPNHPFPGGNMLRAPLLMLAMTWYAMRDRLGV